MKVYHVQLGEAARRDIEAWGARPEAYYVVPGSRLSRVLPADYARKIDGSLVMVKRLGSETTLVALNNNRVDRRAWAIDQDLWAVVVHSSGASTGAIRIGHGEWEGRSTPIPQGFFEAVQRSGIGQYFPLETYPNSTSGPLKDLYGTSHQAAFDELVIRMSSASTST